MSVRSLVCQCVCSVHELRGPFEPPELIPWIRISIGEGDKKGLSAQRPAEDILPNTHTHIFSYFCHFLFLRKAMFPSSPIQDNCSLSQAPKPITPTSHCWQSITVLSFSFYPPTCCHLLFFFFFASPRGTL